MRVYLPSTLSALAAALDAGEIGPAPLSGYAVTPALREWYADGDIEELEYTAMTAAARAALRLLTEPPYRRVVIAVELADSLVTRPSGDGSGSDARALVQITEPVPAARIAAGHVDGLEAMADVRAAVEALPAAAAGDEDAQFTVDGAEGHELLWYATQELGHVGP